MSTVQAQSRIYQGVPPRTPHKHHGWDKEGQRISANYTWFSASQTSRLGQRGQSMCANSGDISSVTTSHKQSRHELNKCNTVILDASNMFRTFKNILRNPVLSHTKLGLVTNSRHILTIKKTASVQYSFMQILLQTIYVDIVRSKRLKYLYILFLQFNASWLIPST